MGFVYEHKASRMSAEQQGLAGANEPYGVRLNDQDTAALIPAGQTAVNRDVILKITLPLFFHITILSISGLCISGRGRYPAPAYNQGLNQARCPDPGLAQCSSPGRDFYS